MGEIAINPTHNIHKKYRTMNLVNPYIFAPPVDLSTNTEIGGVAATISTPALLATKLGIDVSRITNFSTVGSDIKCKITGSYAMGNWSGFYMTYYIDSDNLVNTIPSRCFDDMTGIETLELNGVTSIQGELERNSSIKKWILPQLTTVADGSWGNMFGKPVFIYAPRIVNLGTTIENTGVLETWSGTTFKIYTNPILATINGGNPDGDLIGLRTGSEVRYVTNFTAPNSITTLAAGTIYNTAIQLNFTPPSSTNAIEYYEYYANGVLKTTITASGQYITGLTPNTFYNITLKAVDIFYNKSAVSNSLSVSTISGAVTDLSAGTIYNTAVQLNFTDKVYGANNFKCYANGVLKTTITASGQYITGLTPNTAYNITIIANDPVYGDTAVSNSLSVSTNTTDYDAYNYINISGNSAYETPIVNLFSDLKLAGLYTKLQAFYPFLGTTAAQHKWNAKNPLDTNAAFRLTFSGGGTFSNLGYQCNGTNAYANTYFVPSAQQTLNSNGLTLACGTNNAAASTNVVEIGSYNAASQCSYLMVKNNNTNYKRRTALCNETPEVSQSGINESRGVFTGSRQSSTNTDLFVNGTQVATANQGGSLPNIAIFIGGLNVGGSGVTLSNQRTQFTAIHEGLSDSEVATLHTIIDAFESALGRKTW